MLNQIGTPGPTDRTAIVGSTGSGKTWLGVFLLGSRNWRVRPCYAIDYKHDELLFDAVMAAGGKIIDVRSKPPKKPGLYLVRPRPVLDDEAINDFFYRVWDQENSIVYIDEGYMIPNKCPAFVALLTQGRSKNIEMIVLSQRPVLMSRFVFSEAGFFGIMRLNDRRDRKTVAELTGVDINYDLPKHHFIWYDGASNKQAIFKPVPPRQEIIKLFGGSPRKSLRRL